jgi:hypothetical protein
MSFGQHAVLLLRLETADIIFLSVALLCGLVIVLISNPLTSWVNRLLKKRDDDR